MSTLPRCEERIFHARGMNGYRCQNAGRFEHDGHHYCGTHHPPSIEKRKAEKAEAERRAFLSREKLRKQQFSEMVERDRRAAAFEPLVELVRDLDARFRLGLSVEQATIWKGMTTYRRHVDQLLVMIEGKKR